MQGRQILRAACAFAADASADIQVPCHAAWNPLLLSCLAGEGVHMLETDGIAQCASCPVRHGSHMLSQTERDYAAFSKGLEVRLVLSREITRKAPVTKKRQEPEPERRAFFRKLIPTLAQGAAMTVAQISEAMRDDAVHTEAQDGPTQSPSLRLFTKALARLRPNFTPVPHLPSVPLGTVQADARCNACGQCVAECPTEALTLRPFGAQQVLEFQPDTCIGCEHCADICPEHAITQLPSVSLPAIAAGRSRPLVMVVTAWRRASGSMSTRLGWKLRFTTGRRRHFWNKNCVALGLSAGFLEPLESTSIHLVHRGLALLLQMFPDRHFEPADIARYNKTLTFEYERVRDFLLLHYATTERDDSPLWRHCRGIALPDSLKEKLELFRSYGRIAREDNELFPAQSWLYVMTGQGIRPRRTEPLADTLDPAAIPAGLDHIRAVIRKCTDAMPMHHDFIDAHCRAQ